MDTEKWVYLYGNKYFQISNFGFIRSLDRQVAVYRNGKIHYTNMTGVVLTRRCSKEDPHMFTTIQYNDENQKRCIKTIYLHKAVADHFIDKPVDILLAESEGKKTCATHIVKDYSNNRFDNVKWITMGDVIKVQPNRLADPTKSWRTRKAIYGYSGSRS